MDVQIRTRLLAAALADHDGLAAALGAAKEAEAWLQGAEEPITIDWNRTLAPWGEALLAQILPAPVIESTVEPEAAADVAPAEVFAAAAEPRENGDDTRSEPAPAAAETVAPSRPRAPGASPSWLGATVAAAQSIVARGQPITPATIAVELAIGSATAGWRLREMVKAGRATVSGGGKAIRYHLADTIPGVADRPARPVEEPVQPPEPAPAAEPATPELETGDDARSGKDDLAEPGPEPEFAPGAAEGQVTGSGEPVWLADTMAAARMVEARDGEIKSRLLAATLGINTEAASYRLSQMVKAGLAMHAGVRAWARYRLAEAAPAAPGPDPADIGEAPAAAAPEPEIDLPSAPVAVVPPQDPAAMPADPAAAPTVPPPAAPRPRPAVLIGRNARPVPPPPVIRPAAAMRTTMDDVVAFLRGRGLQVSGGPRGFVYQGLQMSAPELLKTANMIREGLRKPPLIVDGVASR
jgi:hypothetical protein